MRNSILNCAPKVQPQTVLDAAVADAYGWPADLSEDDILARVLALNHQRAAGKAAGQSTPAPKTAPATRTRRSRPQATPSTRYTPLRQPWPKGLAAQLKAVREAIAITTATGTPTAEEVAACFVDASVETVRELVEGLG